MEEVKQSTITGILQTATKRITDPSKIMLLGPFDIFTLDSAQGLEGKGNFSTRDIHGRRQNAANLCVYPQELEQLS